MNVNDLERALLEQFPLADAEAWDHVGLSCGDPSAGVTRVAVALDANEYCVRAAHEAGANVLVTHHPVYLKAPDAFTPGTAELPSCSAAVYTAIRLGVSVMSFHTNLDRSIAAREKLPTLMGMTATASLEHSDDPVATGLGALCRTDAVTLGDLARRAATAFGCAPRVWGDANRIVRTVAMLGGSLGEFGDAAIMLGADAVICGEAGYHVAQDVSQRGCALILLGHDRSEEPFAEILMEAVVRAGISAHDVFRIVPPRQWWTATDKEH